MSLPVSVLIPTKNEEKNIGKCLASVSWADEIYVVDSCSSDRTGEIAQSLGAKVIPFSWDGKGPRKKNWALEALPWKHDWVLVVDADEEVSPALRDEIAAMVSRPSAYTAFLVRYHYYFLGRCLRHGAPLWKLILFRHRAARFERKEVPEVTAYDVELHEYPLVRGQIGRLRSPMIHHDFENLTHYFQRHNIYSDWEALLRTCYRHRDPTGEILPRLFGSAVERRRFLKQCFLNLPGRPWLYFLYAYILRGGFLDGRPGFIYNVLKAFYWYQIGIKEYELSLTKNIPLRKTEALHGNR
jgi:glycosyltransferase involved in cell wall biosynthesis